MAYHPDRFAVRVPQLGSRIASNLDDYDYIVNDDDEQAAQGYFSYFAMADSKAFGKSMPVTRLDEHPNTVYRIDLPVRRAFNRAASLYHQSLISSRAMLLVKFGGTFGGIFLHENLVHTYVKAFWH